MSEPTKAKPSKLLATLTNLVHSPAKLRALLTVLLLGGWYVGFATPRIEEIDTTSRQLGKERSRLELAKQVEHLRKQVARFQERIPATPDASEWMQYMLSGLRRFELKVSTLDTNSLKDAGPYKVVVMRLDVEGSFREVDRFLRWVETNQRLLRVDSLSLTPQKQGKETQDKMKATMVILGLT